MRIVSWNVNSIRVRINHLADFLRDQQPEVVCLQELKVPDEVFPFEVIRGLGYEVVTFGQKTYNGVAILSRLPMTEVLTGLPYAPEGDDEALQRRLISARVGGIRVINVYVPNGQAVGSDKFRFKLSWYTRLKRFLSESFSPDEPLVLLGDFNVAPDERDVWDAAELEGEICFSPDERAALRDLQAWGLTDSFRLHHQEAGAFTWWDYRQAAFRRNRGMRIDHILITEPLVARCRKVWVEIDLRKLEQASDHAPIVAEFDP